MRPLLQDDPPLVSVMMPTFNVERYLSTAIDSILSQDYQNWELVIVDDGSTDNTRKVIESYSEKDPRIKATFSTHVGRGAARNICIEKSSGSFIAILDSDDIALPRRFSLQVRFLQENIDIGILGSQAFRFVDIPDPTEKWHLNYPTEPKDVAEGFNKGKMLILNPSVMMRRSIFEQHGLYKPELLRAQDYEFFQRVHRRGIKFSSLPQRLVYYRQDAAIPSKRYYIDSETWRYYAHYLMDNGELDFSQWRRTISGLKAGGIANIKYKHLSWKLRALSSQTTPERKP